MRAFSSKSLILNLKVNNSMPCSFGLSATGQQYFSLRINQSPATSQQYFSLETNQHQPPAKRTDRKCAIFKTKQKSK
jgi:hypothetical protein